MAFNILYNKSGDVNLNTASIAVFMDSFAQGMGIEKLQIDLDALTHVAAALQRPDFPHADGVEKASPFKKAANFFVWFIAHKPIISELPTVIVGDLNTIPNHQNAIFAYHLAVSCLLGAKIHYADGTVKVLTNPIKVSFHFFRDLVEAFSAASHVHHFKVASLLFEQLSYKANPDTAYPEIICAS